MAVTALLGGYWAVPAGGQAQGGGLAEQQKSEGSVVGDGSVSGVVVASDVSGSLSVSWDVPSPAPSDYRVSWAPSDEDYLTWTDLSGNSFPTVNKLEITGLDPARTYKIRVRARYRTGQWANARWAGDWAPSAFGVPDGGGVLPAEPAGTVLAGRLVLGSGSSGGDGFVGYSRGNAGMGSFDARYWDSVVFWHHVGLFSVSQIKGTPARGPAANLDNPIVLSGSLLMGNVTPFLLEVGGRTLSSEHAVTPAGARGYMDYWIWDNPCADWQTADEAYLRIIKTDASDPRLDHTGTALGSLSIDGADLDTAFDPTAAEHTATADADTDQVTIDVTAADTNACAVDIVPADADPDAAGHQIDLGDAGAVAVISVTAADNATTSSHTLTIGRGDAQPAAVADAQLDGVEVEFDPNQQRYEADIPPGTTETTLELTPAGDSTVDGYVFNPGNSGLDPVADGGTVPLQRNRETLIAVKVSAPDNSQQDYYTIRLQPPDSNNDNPPPATPATQNSQRDTTLKLAAPSAATATSLRTATVTPDEARSADLTTTTDSNRGFDLHDGDRGFGLHGGDHGSDLAVTRAAVVPLGEWLERTQITPHRGTSPRTVPVQSVPRNNGAEPELSALSVSPGTLAPAFAAATHRYTASVDADVDEITVAATAVSGATAHIAAPDADPDTAGHQVALNAGTTGGPAAQTAILIVVTAGTKIDSYTLVVTRAAPPNDDATLSSLTISSGTLDPAFASNTTAYTATVANTVTEITITTATTDTGATIATLPADSDGNTPGHQISLDVGTNIITTTVTAADSVTTSTYTTTITRTGASTDATLSSLTISSGNLDQTFVAGRGTYTATVPNTTAQITVTATPADDGATIVISPPDADLTTAGHQANLVPATGENAATTIAVAVTAADDTTLKTYRINVTRSAPIEPLTFELPAGCELHDLGSSSKTPWITYDLGNCDSLYRTDPQRGAQYYRMILRDEGQVRLRADTESAAHLIVRSPDGTILAVDNPPPEWPDYHQPKITQTLAAGTYVIEVALHYRWRDRSHRLVFSGTTIVKPAAYKLADIQISDVNMSGFEQSKTAYQRNVAADVTAVTVSPSTTPANGVVTIEPADADPATAAHDVTLESDGSTEITVSVSSPEFPGVATSYSVQLNRLDGTTSPLSDDATLQSLSFDSLDFGQFSSDKTQYTYTLSYDQSLTGLADTMTPQTNHAGATWTTSHPDDDADSGHQITLDGGDAVTITVTSQDNAIRRTYRIEPVTGFAYDSSKNICLRCATYDTPDERRSRRPRGLTTDGQSFFVLNDSYNDLISFNRESLQQNGQHVLWGPVETFAGHRYIHPQSMWSDGTTLWVSYRNINRLYAYSLASKARLPAKDVVLNQYYKAIWSDGNVWYLAGTRGPVYKFDPEANTYTWAFNIQEPRYNQNTTIWSDGQTLWMAALFEPIRAYDLQTGKRLPGLDLDVQGLVGGDPPVETPYAIWSDGHTMWVGDNNEEGVYAFTLPENARLKSLSVSDGDIGVFHSGVFDYSVEVPSGTTTTTVEAVAAFTGGSSAVAFDTADANGNDSGHQVTLDSSNPTTVTITVTAPNGTDTDTYTVTITVADDS